MSLKRDDNYDATVPPVAKKAKLDSAPGPEFMDLNSLVLDCMLSYLDVKSLFRFAFSCKGFGEVVTHEHVVRSALISGGHTSKTVTEVIDLSIGKEQVLFLPSPLRLLRLANGKTCEGGYCCSWLGEKGKKVTAQVNHIRPRTGLFFCFECLVRKTKKISMKHPMLKNQRVCRNEYSENAYVLIAPYTDAAGERAGPIVTLKDHNARGVSALLHEADSQWPQEKKESILKCFEDAKQDRKESQKRVAEARSNRIKGKQEKAIALAAKLMTMLGEDCPHRDRLCGYRKLRTYKPKDPTIAFKCKFVNEEMSPLVLAPSKGTKKRVKEIAGKIRDGVESVVSSGFLDFAFLEGDATVNPWESALKTHLLGAFPSNSALESMDTIAIDLVHQNRPFQIVTRWESRWFDFAVPMMLERTGDASPPPPFSEGNVYTFAKAVYRKVRHKHAHRLPFSERCETAIEEFERLLPLAAEFAQYTMSRMSDYITSARERIYDRFFSYYWDKVNFMKSLEERAFEDLFNEMYHVYDREMY